MLLHCHANSSLDASLRWVLILHAHIMLNVLVVTMSFASFFIDLLVDVLTAVDLTDVSVMSLLHRWLQHWLARHVHCFTELNIIVPSWRVDAFICDHVGSFLDDHVRFQQALICKTIKLHFLVLITRWDNLRISHLVSACSTSSKSWVLRKALLSHWSQLLNVVWDWIFWASSWRAISSRRRDRRLFSLQSLFRLRFFPRQVSESLENVLTVDFLVFENDSMARQNGLCDLVVVIVHLCKLRL